MSTVIITGSRNWTVVQLIYDVLDEEHRKRPITLLVEGGAKGADDIAARWAYTRGVRHVCIPANWHAYGKKAGPIRNIEMLDAFPNARVIAFPMADSVGTRHCMNVAAKRGMEVFCYGY